MKIKQLKWRGYSASQRAETPVGAYTAGFGWWYYNNGAANWVDPLTLDAAKAACQADFERRVRECVEGSELDAIRAFCERVNRMAEDKMMATGKLEGSHYAAMRQILKEMEDAK